MKILLAHNYYQSSAPSGEDTVFENEKHLLEKNNFLVVPYTKHNDTIQNTNFINRTSIALNSIWSKSTYKEVKHLIIKEKPAIAHFHNTFPLISPSAYAACKDSNIPVIQTLHNYRLICPGAILQRNNKPCEDCINSSLLPAIQHRCYRQSFLATTSVVAMLSYNRFKGSYYNHVDNYIALTEFAKDKLIAGGLPKDKIAIKPNFLPDSPSVGLGEGDYAVFTGRLSQEKGVLTLLLAWQSIHNLALKIIGDGPLKLQLEKYAIKHNLNVEFLGHISKKSVLEITRDAKMAIIPSEWYEGQPMVLLEAYACGTPVIASNIGSLSSMIKIGTTGYTFTPGDHHDLSAKILTLLANNKIQGMRASARNEFESNYMEQRNFKKLRKIYQNALNLL